jgi:hypothetical protein
MTWGEAMMFAVLFSGPNFNVCAWATVLHTVMRNAQRNILDAFISSVISS